jgi:hypothetical protein
LIAFEGKGEKDPNESQNEGKPAGEDDGSGGFFKRVSFASKPKHES